MDCNMPISSVHGTLQARTPEYNIPNPGIEPMFSAWQADFFFFLITEPPGKPPPLFITYFLIVEFLAISQILLL